MSNRYTKHFATDPMLNAVIKDLIDSETFDSPVSHTWLSHLGDALELPCAQRIENNAHVFRITREINEFLSAARFYVSGPYGRRVAIGTPEIDLVVFLIVDLKSGKDDHLIEAPDLLLDGLYKHFLMKFENNPAVKVYPVSTATKWSELNEQTSLGLSSETTPPYLPLTFVQARFRIFLAPALASDPEEQRQAAYKLLERVLAKKGRKAIVRLYPTLFERPSEEIACERPEIHSFCRLCQYWIRLQNLKTLDPQATEILSILAARQTLAQGAFLPHELSTHSQFIENSNESFYQTFDNKPSTNKTNALDFYAAFLTFLQYCVSLEELPHSLTASIQPPCPLQSYPLDQTSCVIYDEFNPYRNLLQSLSGEDRQRLLNQASKALQLLRPSRDSAFPTGKSVSHREKTKSSVASSKDLKESSEENNPVLIKDIFTLSLDISENCYGLSCLLPSNRKSYKTSTILLFILSFFVALVCIVQALISHFHYDINALTKDFQDILQGIPVYMENIRIFMNDAYSSVSFYFTKSFENLIISSTDFFKDVFQ